MATMSIIALFIVLFLAMVIKFNVGLLGIAFAFIIGTVGSIEASKIYAGFPANLFLILVGTSYLFGIAHQNGTMSVLANYCIRMVRGRAALLPFVFGAIGFLLCTVGAGSITMCAMLFPPAMVVAEKEKINPTMMALVVGLITLAGDYSPYAVFGAMWKGFYQDVGVTGLSPRIFIDTIIIYCLVAFMIYIYYGGLKLWKRSSVVDLKNEIYAQNEVQVTKLDKNHIITMAGIAVFIIGAIIFQFHIGLWALTVGIVLCFLKAGDEGDVIKSIPWPIVLLLCGVTLLIQVMQLTGGIDLAVNAVASISNQVTLIPIVTFFGSLVSVFTSNMGVVMPAFTPMLTPLAEAVGGVNIPDLYTTFAVATSLSDVSPLSTLGAIALASATASMDKNKIFKGMIIYGLGSTIFGTLICWWLIISIL